MGGEENVGLALDFGHTFQPKIHALARILIQSGFCFCLTKLFCFWAEAIQTKTSLRCRTPPPPPFPLGPPPLRANQWVGPLSLSPSERGKEGGRPLSCPPLIFKLIFCSPLCGQSCVIGKDEREKEGGEGRRDPARPRPMHTVRRRKTSRREENLFLASVVGGRHAKLRKKEKEGSPGNCPFF